MTCHDTAVLFVSCSHRCAPPRLAHGKNKRVLSAGSRHHSSVETFAVLQSDAGRHIFFRLSCSFPPLCCFCVHCVCVGSQVSYVAQSFCVSTKKHNRFSVGTVAAGQTPAGFCLFARFHKFIRLPLIAFDWRRLCRCAGLHLPAFLSLYSEMLGLRI